MAAMDVAQALAFLQVQSPGDGTSVYEHLVTLVAKVLEEKPSKAVDLLEASLLAKKSTFDAKESSPLVPIPAIPDASRTVAAASLFGARDLPIDPQTGEPIAAVAPNEFESESMFGAQVVLDSLGVGLGREEMTNVALVIKRIGEDPKAAAKRVRFFGKLLGLYSDYYVFEVLYKTAPEVPDLPAGEVPAEKGVGANAFTYLVTSSLGGPLERLPHVTPAQIKASRYIKKLLTGRLASPVASYPAFPGNEANYLRALIARIAAATVLAPAGLFSADDETGELQAAEDFEPQPGREMAQAANWVHARPHLKKQGRAEVFKRELPEDADEDEFYTEDELEEGPEVLAGVEEDAPLAAGQGPAGAEEVPAWSPLVSSASEAVKTQAGGLRSLVWPGAFCGARGADWTNVYVGWGVKNAPFVPAPPPPVATEFDQAQVETQELVLMPVPPPPEAEGEEEE